MISALARSLMDFVMEAWILRTLVVRRGSLPVAERAAAMPCLFAVSSLLLASPILQKPSGKILLAC